jgi:hypothetical protein
MKMSTVISLVELSYGLLAIPGLLSIVGCLFYLRGGMLAVGIGSVLFFFITAFYLKMNLVNYYLKRCKYPFEFLSALKHLKMLGDLEVVWHNKGANKAFEDTKAFLSDNKLSTGYGTMAYGSFLSFKEEGLVVEQKLYPWKHINSWELIAGNNEIDRIEIKYTDIDNKEKKAVINLAYVNAGHINTLLLMAHFKGRFGEQENDFSRGH